MWRNWYWEERFPDWRALRAYFSHVDRIWDIRRDVRCDSRLAHATWSEPHRSWTLTTETAEQFVTRFVVMCTGFAARAYVPTLPGLDTFKGTCHHTARWPQDGFDMTGARVGIIGTGASGVQVAQEAAKVAERVTVFQRTPILALPMRQRRLTRAEQDAEKPGYPARFRKRALSQSGFDYDSAGSSAMAVSASERRDTFDRLWAEGGFAFWAGGYSDLLIDEAANRLAYDYWREHVRERIDDQGTAEHLAPETPLHPFGVKRPSLEQSYYDIFNQDNVSLVDLRTDPVQRITPAGVETATAHHDVDLLVMATGFDAVTGGLTCLDIVGVGGHQLRDHWSDGVRTQLGLASAGFPNLFFLYGPQSPSGFCNGPTCAEVQGDWVIELMTALRDENTTRIEATPEAENNWRNTVHAIADMTLFPRADSWYMGANIPGKPREMLNWPGGLQMYLSACRSSAERGYEGFVRD